MTWGRISDTAKLPNWFNVCCRILKGKTLMVVRGKKKRCSGILKENKMKGVKDRRSGWFLLVQGSRGGAEIRVCRRQKKEGGKEEGTG